MLIRHLLIRIKPQDLGSELPLVKLIILRDLKQKYMELLDQEAIEYQCKLVKRLHLLCQTGMQSTHSCEQNELLKCQGF